jgi:hypothetical protein
LIGRFWWDVGVFFLGFSMVFHSGNLFGSWSCSLGGVGFVRWFVLLLFAPVPVGGVVFIFRSGRGLGFPFKRGGWTAWSSSGPRFSYGGRDYWPKLLRVVLLGFGAAG